MNVYTVIGLIDRATGTLTIAGVLRGDIDTCDKAENTDTIRWSCRVKAGDVFEAETSAHYVHRLGGIPAEHRPTELLLGSVVIDDLDRERHVRGLSLDDDAVQVWFVDDPSRPAAFPSDSTVLAVLTPSS